MKNEMNDEQLRQWLQPLQAQAPNKYQMKNWQNVVMREAARDRLREIVISKFQWPLQLVAAVLFGVAMTSILFLTYKASVPESQFIQISFNDATFERSHDNLH